jgi:hypothetical protein
MVAEKGNKKLGASGLKDKSQIVVAAAFEELGVCPSNGHFHRRLEGVVFL